MYPGVELRLLRYVVAVAEELHFSRAAKKLHVTQPSLSKQIIELEEQLGIELFERTKREVRLRDAGRIFVKEARQALLYSQRAVHLTKASHYGPNFDLGYSPHINLQLLFRAKATLASEFPTVKTSFVSAFSHAQLQLIQTGEVHAGLVAMPISGDEITIQPIHREPLVIVISRKSYLSSKKTIRLADLRDEPMIAIAKHIHPGFYQYLHDACVRHGFVPKVLQEVTTLAECLRMVAEGGAYTFMPSCYEQFQCAGVVFRPIEKHPLWLDFGIAHKTEVQSPIIQRLVFCLENKKKPHPVRMRSSARSA